MKSSNDDTLRFIASSFRSVWALELLLMLKRGQRSWSREELVTILRASELVVAKALEGLEAAGLATVDAAGVRYFPVNDDAAALVERAEALYARRPDAVRRAIVSESSGNAAAFANAFRLRKD